MSPYAAHDMQSCAERYRYYGISLGLSIDQHVLRRTFALTFWYASVVQDDPRAVHCSYTSCLATVTLCFVIREVLLLFQRVTIKNTYAAAAAAAAAAAVLSVCLSTSNDQSKAVKPIST
jgi:hypothetical protein